MKAGARIETARLALRPVERSDLPDLLEVNGDPEVTRFLPYPTWTSLDDGAAPGLDGGLFAFDAGIAGRPDPRFPG